MSRVPNSTDAVGKPDREPIMCPRCLCCQAVWDRCAECFGHGFLGVSPTRREDATAQMCRACRGMGGEYSCTGNCDSDGKHATPVAKA